MSSRPKTYTSSGETVMSNFDHDIDEQLAKSLKTRKEYDQYSGWNFCGYVWWDRKAKTYKCEVWHYNVPQKVYSGTLEQIMENVCQEWGDD